MAFKLTYVLTGLGWAAVRIQDGEAHLDMAVSYLHDALRDLAVAAWALASGAESARVVFMDEPSEVQLLLERAGDSLHYEARWFEIPNSWGNDPSEPFKVVFSGVTTVRRFAGEVRSQLEALLRVHGVAGYKKRWRAHDFPEELLVQLQKCKLAMPLEDSEGGASS